MRTTKLDLALALAGAARGYTAKRKDDDNVSLILDDGFIYVHKKVGRDCRIEHSKLWLEWNEEVWYLEEDDRTWLDQKVKS